jgi:hypothetical protein
MLDIFVVALLASLVRAGALATIIPGAGALAFASVVVMTMLASLASTRACFGTRSRRRTLFHPKCRNPTMPDPDSPSPPPTSGVPQPAQAPRALAAIAGLADPDRRGRGRHLAADQHAGVARARDHRHVPLGRGLTPGKTAVRYKDVDIGLVKSCSSLRIAPT